MWLENINIQNIRSLKDFQTNFSNKLNIILGPNGSGKTSILESIHLLSLGKSFRKGSEKNLINSKEDFIRVKGIINSKQRPLNISLSKNYSEKRIKVNNIKLKSRSELIGLFPTVIFSPETLDIISGGRIARLSFFNRIFCTIDKEYTHDLIQFEKILIQKKFLLKNRDESQLDYWNELFAEKAHKIWKKRYKLWIEFIEDFKDTWNVIFPEKTASIKYMNYSEMNVSKIINKLKKIKKLEVQSGRLNYGPQKDEFIFFYNSTPIKEFGSQGEKKFFHYVLKLVEGEYIKKKSGKTPVFLLDDLFAKIDSIRIEKMLGTMVDKFQMFITSTDIHKEGVKSWVTNETKLINL